MTVTALQNCVGRKLRRKLLVEVTRRPSRTITVTTVTETAAGAAAGGRGPGNHGIAVHHTSSDLGAEVRCSFTTTTVRDESQVTPQGRHR